MADLKPPRVAGDERETLLALLQYQRESIVRKIADVNEHDARRRLVDSDTTLLWLLKHLRRAEIVWVLVRFRGEAVTIPDDSVEDADTVRDAIDDYRQTWADVDRAIAGTSLDDGCRNVDDGGPPVPLRWVLMHLLEETARHAGHADILRELIDGQTGR